MFESLLADGLGSGLSEKVASYFIKGLAVAGGFLIGYFLGKVVAWALDRWVFANKAPDQLKKAVSLVAGVAMAILVALLVFGDGGKGLFGSGGGAGEGKGDAPANEKGQNPVTPPEKKDTTPPKAADPVKQPDPKPTPGDIRVAILAGDEVREGKFFVFDDEPTPKTFEEFKEAINARRKTAKSEITVVFRYKKEQLSDSNQTIRRLDAWMREAKLNSRFE